MTAILAAILDDVAGPQQRHNLRYLPYFVNHITSYLPKVKSFRYIATQQKPKGVSIRPPPRYNGGVYLYFRGLSGILAKSGPLDFATKNSFPLFFVCEKGLVHMYQNHFIYFPILYFCFATSQNQFCPQRGFRR